MTYNNKLTLPAMFRNAVESYSDKTSIVFAGENNYTYREMGEEVNLIAEMLLELGVSKGDKVAILSTNMPNWGKAFFAISLVGAVAVPILPDFHTREIHTILEHSESKILFVSESLYNTLSAETYDLLGAMVLIDNFAIIPKATPARHLTKLESSLPINVKNYSPANVEEEDLASIIYTSGTTGNSKGVMLSHKNLTWTARQSRTLQKIVPEDRFLSILPLVFLGNSGTSQTVEGTM